MTIHPKPVDDPIESLQAAREELDLYSGTPKCMDCKWKLGSPITDNCGCRGGSGGANEERHNQALLRARKLQNYLTRYAEATDAEHPGATLAQTFWG